MIYKIMCTKLYVYEVPFKCTQTQRNNVCTLGGRKLVQIHT